MSTEDRQKQIDIIARSFSMQSHAGDPRSFSEGIELGFKAGAAWADRNPANKWHDASEEPREYPILCQDELGNVWVQYSLNDYVDGWKEFKGFESLIRWAYISDLLPKGGAK